MKILIVDDENVSRKILLKKMELIGECTAVDDSLYALELFNNAVKTKKPFNLVTLDVSMPKMDGRKLLSTIRKTERKMKTPREDRVKIIMVTSRMNVSTIKECIKLGCNGYISKPVNKYQLLENLSRMGLAQPPEIQKDDKKTHSRIVAKIIKRFYKGQIKLPVLPKIVEEAKLLLEGQEPSIEDLAKIIQKDILITSKLIAIANSPLYRGVDNAVNLNAGLLRLGMEASQGLISTIVTKDLFKSDNKVLNGLLEKLWMHSFACGCLGKRIAQQLGMPNAESVFLMGIVHDIGKMLLIKAIVDMNPEETFEDGEMLVAIHEIHTTFGAAVLKKMRFSKEFIHVAEFHHWNDFSKDDAKELLIIHLSDYLANKIGFGFFDAYQNYDKPGSDFKKNLENLNFLKQLNLETGKIMEIADEIKILVKDSAHAF
ncbi:MAG: HDOD domain-containing protein [Deltaproteobacteria bacterium]|nr:HDOD domain-containing protein [Deltaproteobacteria bacterium]